MTDIRKVLAANIKAFRKEKGLTQANLADQAGTATHYIAMIEGCKNFPSPDMIERIAVVFGKYTVDLFALNPIRHDWKTLLLSDISTLVDQRLNEITNTESNKQKHSKKDSSHI
jgi:transcriptional regulator with XRE-family HTH domain